MNADEFVFKLSKLTPSLDHLIKCGYPQVVAEEIRNSYVLNKKEKPEKIFYNDPLVNLICCYDTSNFRIGLLTLGMQEHDFRASRKKIHVGAIEADILVIDSQTGSVELLDHAQPDFVIAYCAASGNCFLEAVLLLAGFEPPNPDIRNLSKSQRIENNRAAGDLAIQCAKVANVSIPPNIYNELLGYDSSVINATGKSR